MTYRYFGGYKHHCDACGIYRGFHPVKVFGLPRWLCRGCSIYVQPIRGQNSTSVKGFTLCQSCGRGRGHHKIGCPGFELGRYGHPETGLIPR